MIKKRVHKAIKEVHPDSDFILLTPKNPDHGDYAVHTRSLSNPKLLTEGFEHELVGRVEQIDDFINFSVSTPALWKEVERILAEKESYGNLPVEHPKRIDVEFGDPNTHKLPHIGHLFSYIVGESWARILEAAGNMVHRTIYQGDVGLHVAKCLYVVQKEKDSIGSASWRIKTLEEKVQFLQKAYQEGSTLYERDGEVKKDIDELNKKIYEKDSSVNSLWQETRNWSVEYYAQFEKQLGIVYDTHYFESMVAEKGKNIVTENIGSVFEESEGAIIFPGEKMGLHNRVFINRFGNPTYEAKDVGLALTKYEDWPFDTSFITTASEQNAYFNVILAVLDRVAPQLKGKVQHIGFGMVDLKSGKMSSRTGNIVSAVELVEMVKKEVEKLSEIHTSTLPVTLAAIKYYFLKSEARKNMSFDIEESISLHGNSGPYMLYTYSRIYSILEKTESTVMPNSTPHQASSQEELALLRTLIKFPEVVENAAEKMAPHLIATYLFDLSQKFNRLYESTPILKAPTSERVKLLKLIEATAIVLKNGLHLLGIETVEKI